MAVLEDNYRYSNQFQREKIQLSPDSIPNAGWLAPFSHGQEQAIPEGRNSHKSVSWTTGSGLGHQAGSKWELRSLKCLLQCPILLLPRQPGSA